MMKLQQCQLNQVEGKEWYLRNSDNETLTILPQKLTDGEVIAILEFAKKYEKAAFESGWKEAVEQLEVAHNNQIAYHRNRITSLEHHNAMLATKIDDLLTNGEDSS